MLNGFVGVNLLVSASGLSIDHVGMCEPVALLLYALVMRTIFRYEQVHELPTADTDDARYAAMTLSQAVTGYVLATLVVAGAFGRLAWARR